MIRVVVIVAILVGAHGVAEACKAKGKVLYRQTTGPLPDPPVTTEVTATELTVWATGAWRYVAGDRRDTGCLSKPHLKELKRTLGKAKFKLVTDQATCRALSTMELVHASPKRKKKVKTAAPCGTPVDEWTANLAACAELAREDAKPAKWTLRERCRGEEAPIIDAR